MEGLSVTLDQSLDLQYICEYLKCYKVRNNSIITRCIYCGDSIKHPVNHGHFYMFRDFPFCTCFRCGTQLTVERWLYDLEIAKPELKPHIENFRNFLHEHFGYETFLRRRPKNLASVNQLVQKINKNGYPLWFQSFISHLSIHPSYYGVYGYDDNGIIVLSYNYGQVAIKTRDEPFQIKPLTNLGTDIFLFTHYKSSLSDNTTVYVTESILDAILLSDRFKIPVLASNGQFHINQILRFIQLFFIPKQFTIIYDADVNQRIIKLHMKRYMFALKRYNVKVNYTVFYNFKDSTDMFLYRDVFAMA